MVEVQDAVAQIPVGARIVAAPACGAPTTLLAALGAAAQQDRRWTLSTGLLLDYPFLDAVAERRLAYRTWHVMPALRELVAGRLVDYLPMRASYLSRALRSQGVDAVLVRVSPPDADGNCSLGPSASYSAAAIAEATLRIGEVDETMPKTCGDSTLPASLFDLLVPTSTPMPSYRAGEPNDVSRTIAASMLELLPPRPTLQIGIGTIPEALVSLLSGSGLEPLRFVGMATDAMVDLDDEGLIDREARCPTPAILTPEMMGTSRLMAFGNGNPMVGVYPSSLAHDSGYLGGLERFVSIVSAIEVDLSGQVISETIGGRLAGAVGGSLDYIEAATRSEGGLRFVALPSTSSDGRISRIVAKLGGATPVTIPRTMVDLVVTEYGVARLDGRSLHERAQALMAVAHPDHRDALAAAHSGA